MEFKVDLHESDKHGSFSEFLYSSGGKSRVALLAPHGGQIEPNTDTQVEMLAQFLDSDVDVWGTRGIVNESDYNAAYNRWHTTSETHPLSVFSLYQQLVGREYDVAISFHVMSDSGVVVGGRADESVRERLASKLNSFFPGQDISVASKGDRLAGMSDNFVNCLDAEDSIHLEQSKELAFNHPVRFVRAVNEWVREEYF